MKAFPVIKSIISISIFYCFFIFSALHTAQSLETVLARCCNLGVRWAWDNKTCAAYPGPVSQVPVEHQPPCLSTIDACCQRNYRERNCVQGHEDAKAGFECMVASGPDGHYRKDCCEGCKLGLIAGAMGLQCEFQSLKLALGPPWDASLNKCCLQAGGGALPVHSAAGPRDISRPHQNPGTGRPQERQDICALFPGQLCSHNCVNDGDTFKCTCREGYTLLRDGKSCILSTAGVGNPTSRTTGEPRRDSTETNLITKEKDGDRHVFGGGQCPVGFVYSSQTQVCDDIDECQTPEGLMACRPYKTCKNTIGSFVCEQESREDEKSQRCPPGYRYNEDTSSCEDIDECAEGFDICIREIQYCINTPGGFDCRAKKEFTRYNCPAGYKFNNSTLNCEDVDECSEKLHSCEEMEVCRNTPGAYECDIQCTDGFRYDVRLRLCQDINECKEGTHDCVIDTESCVNVPGSYQCHQIQADENNCPPGFEPNKNFTFLCQDTNECSSGRHTCALTETCVNENGGYRCEGKSTKDTDQTSSTESDDENKLNGSSASTLTPRFVYRSTDSEDATTESSIRLERKSLIPPPRPTPAGCAVGFRQKQSSSSLGPRPESTSQPECEDIDECTENNPCDSSQHCQNTVGSFYCHCRRGYYRDPITRACLDINECQTGQHNCQPSQRCDNYPGSFTCIRITGCGTGYTLNSQTGQCEDDDECLFGNHDCDHLGPEWVCRNTLGSFRCEKNQRNCPHGLTLAPNGECRTACTVGYQFNSRGECVDIDECNTPGRRVCSAQNQCVNSQGSYQCIPRIICPAGYQADQSTSKCIDIDECVTGQHTCRGNQQCLNRGGGYICQCPRGFTVTSSGDCEDIDECGLYGGQVCASNSECYNTQGSFRCICKDGFEQGTDNRTCTDVDECVVIKGLCEQNCINTWGSYKCSCGVGFAISEDGRRCRDVDECAQVKDGFLCIGNCVNTHGSFRCSCPEGYTLSSDGRTCQDIDECERPNACHSDETCLNTRGGFRCNRVNCPYGYQKEGEQNDRCKKTTPCTERDLQCLKEPLTISRNYISFTSNIRIPAIGYVDMFTMRGPNWVGSVMHFTLEMKSQRSPQGVQAATRQHFLLRRPQPHQAVVALAKPISGPQDVELELTMEVYHRGTFAGSAVAQIVIVVTTYEY